MSTLRCFCRAFSALSLHMAGCTYRCSGTVDTNPSIPALLCSTGGAATFAAYCQVPAHPAWKQPRLSLQQSSAPSHPLLFIPFNEFQAVPCYTSSQASLKWVCKLLALSPPEAPILNPPAASSSLCWRQGTRLLCSSKTHVTVSEIKTTDGCNTGRREKSAAA